MIRKFRSLSPTKQRRYIIVGVAIFILGAAVLVTKFSHREPLRGVKTDTEVDVLLPKKKDTTLEGLAAEIVATQKRLQDLDRYIRAMEPNIKEAIRQKLTQMDEKLAEDTEKRLKTLEAKVDVLTQEIQKGGVPSQGGGGVVKAPPVSVMPPPPVGVGRTQDVEPEEEEEPHMELRVVGETAVEPAEERKTSSKASLKDGGVTERDLEEQKVELDDASEAFIPSGSIIQGVLLSGMDAPCGNKAAKNPVPALVRIKHDAILPNRFVQDVKECFLIVSGYGSMSTERANLRSEKLSCVRPDGKVIEAAVDGWVVGDDGKAGLRGRLVSKQGKVIANSLVAGVLSGLAGSFQPRIVTPLNISPTTETQYQYPTPEGVLNSAVLGGGSKALDRIAEFYLDMADEMFPIVEIDAGRKLTVVLVRGVKLKIL